MTNPTSNHPSTTEEPRLQLNIVSPDGEAPRFQLVVAFPDSGYKVRTYEGRDGKWVQVREVPASFRDIAQATLDGNVIEGQAS
jgi:hypothetical protein